MSRQDIKSTILVIAMIAVTFCALRCAAEQVFKVEVIPTPTPRPTYRECDDLPEYDLSSKDVKILSRLLWSSPLYSESEKVKLLWVVFNRIDYGDPFGDSVEDVVTKNEFTFYDRKARISDKNKELVEREMTRWLAYKDGYGIGWHPPKNALYCRFIGKYNRNIELMSDSTGKALEW